VLDPAMLVVVDERADEQLVEEARLEKRRMARLRVLSAKLAITLGAAEPSATTATAPVAATATTAATATMKVEELGRKRKKKAANPEAVRAAQARRYHDVARHADGSPVLPFTVFRGLVVHALGKVVADKKHFHSKKYIWPVGFRSTREYTAMGDTSKKAQYVQEIIAADDGDGDRPLFRVTCLEEGKPPVAITAETSSGVWAAVLKKVNDSREAEGDGKRSFTQLSGPEQFGLSHPTVIKLLQELPGADKLEKYEMVTLEPTEPAAKKKKKREKDKTKKTKSTATTPDDDGDEDDEDGDT
jgi:hypothetical protein